MSDRCILTGASAGLGRTIAETLLRRGDRVLAIGRDVARLQSLQTLPGDLQSIAADASAS